MIQPPTYSQKCAYYRGRCLILMGSIEEKTSRCFHELYPEEELDFVRENDNLSGLRRLHNKLCRIWDNLNSDYQFD